MTLDIVDFGEQVTAPAMSSVVRKVDDAIGTRWPTADTEVDVDLDEDDPYLGLVDARIALNNANVPASQRFLAVGSSVEAAILKSDRLSKFDQSGSSDALREAIIGRIAGFTAVSAIGSTPTSPSPPTRRRSCCRSWRRWSRRARRGARAAPTRA
jgi:hypothetical protein